MSSLLDININTNINTVAVVNPLVTSTVALIESDVRVLLFDTCVLVHLLIAFSVWNWGLALAAGGSSELKFDGDWCDAGAGGWN